MKYVCLDIEGVNIGTISADRMEVMGVLTFFYEGELCVGSFENTLIQFRKLEE